MNDNIQLTFGQQTSAAKLLEDRIDDLETTLKQAAGRAARRRMIA